jgi:hypothetical protein
LSDYIEPSRTHVSNLNGGVLFANYRYNRDDDKYTPLVYNYIEANHINLENIYTYFKDIINYFKKIDKVIIERYKAEFSKVALEDEKHPEYKYRRPNNRYQSQASRNTEQDIEIEEITNNRISIIKKQLLEYSDDFAEKKLSEMRSIIDDTQKEIDNIYLQQR